MSAYFLIDLRFEPYRIRASQERAETVSRLAFLAIDRGELALRAVGAYLAGATRLAMARFNRWHDLTTAEHILNRLDDHLLQDIGLTRDGIHAAVHSGSIWKVPESSEVPVVAASLPGSSAGRPVEWRKAA
jgi:uncharacterized protein YjiS (DUF1127 family)